MYGDGRLARPAARKIAIVAALEREVKPLIAHWPSHEREHGDRKFRFFENEDTVLICGGMGAEAARRATEAVIALYAPAIICSAGFAGALQSDLKVGDIVVPRRVVDARDGSCADAGEGDGVLVTVSSIASRREKAQLAASYGAVAADMEAAAVARGAQARGVRFAAVKSISDESGFALPPMQRFIRPGGEFDTSGFVRFAILRPWLWTTLVRLAGNSRRAARGLSRHLETMIQKSAQRSQPSAEHADEWNVAKR
jgi:adenosylhomocysteine nucleosidase